jgi:hypothetical protein
MPAQDHCLECATERVGDTFPPRSGFSVRRSNDISPLTSTQNRTHAHMCAATPPNHAGVDFQKCGMDELVAMLTEYPFYNPLDNPYSKTQQDLIEILYGFRRLYTFKTEVLRDALRLNQVYHHKGLNTC